MPLVLLLLLLLPLHQTFYSFHTQYCIHFSYPWLVMGGLEPLSSSRLPFETNHVLIPWFLLPKRPVYFLDFAPPSMPSRFCTSCWSSCWKVCRTALGSIHASCFVHPDHTWPLHHSPCQWDGRSWNSHHSAVGMEQQFGLFCRGHWSSSSFWGLYQLPWGCESWK